MVTVSTDTQFVHLAWKRDEKSLENVKFPMAADPTGEVSRMFGVYDEATGLALRGTYIIDPEGTVLNSEVKFYNMGRNVDQLLRKVDHAFLPGLLPQKTAETSQRTTDRNVCST